MKIGFITSVLLAVLAHSAMAAEHSGRLRARVCAGDFERLCAKQVAVPAVDDFRDGGPVNRCLKEKINQLSTPCWYVIIQGGS